MKEENIYIHKLSIPDVNGTGLGDCPLTRYIQYIIDIGLQNEIFESVKINLSILV